MCGMVGAVANKDVSAMRLEGLQRLEYRGYDSASIALHLDNNKITRPRVKGKVKGLREKMAVESITGNIGIGQTTHGEPSEKSAHPHVSGEEAIALVHNGIIENHSDLRKQIGS